MYSQMAQYYDKLYSFKDYQAEVERLLPILALPERESRYKLLDVACGTGMHLKYLKEYFDCTGIDLCPELLCISRERNPEVTHYEMDMSRISLSGTFDVITCFFGSIGHLCRLDLLEQTLSGFARLLAEDGMMVIEPWHSPSEYRVGTVSHLLWEGEGQKISRLSVSLEEDGLSVLDMHHLIGTPNGVTHFREELRLGMWTDAEFEAIFSELGYAMETDRIRDNGRRMIVARRRG